MGGAIVMLAAPVPILLYHGVSTDASPAFRRWVVEPNRLAEHLACLTAGGFQPVTVSQVALALGGRWSLPDRPVAVTFDDGFADFADGAFPILSRLAFPATLYVTTGYVGSSSRWLDRAGEGARPMLDWATVRQLDRSGLVEIGAHGHTHRQLDVLPARDLPAEIDGPKCRLEDQLGHRIASFAYPHGYSSRRVRGYVAAAGFTSACAVKHALSGPSDDRYALGRIVVEADTTVEALHAMVRGDGLRVAPRAGARSAGWRLLRRAHAQLPRSRRRSRWLSEEAA
jgi:peptidoglycan/xylan/chitin deacetylase (PgdA/CDA1 family)